MPRAPLHTGLAALAATALALALATPTFAAPSGPAWTTDALGSTAIFHMKTAPFPHAGRPYTDDRVMVFVPAGFRPGPTVDVVVHYHGFSADIVQSDARHHYREQLALSKKNAILLEPQGPLHARDGAGGKHSDVGGEKRFLDEALAVLVREGVVSDGTTLGTLVVSGHSGAYQVISDVLDHGGVPVNEVHLQDALYGQLGRFEAWARQPGHKLVSTCTPYAGTAANNDTLAATLENDGVTVARDDSDASLASAPATFIHTDVAHDDVTFARWRWADTLVHSQLSDLGCPRPRLASVARTGDGNVVVSWYPSRSALCRGYRLSWSPDGQGPFEQVVDEATLDASTTSITLGWAAGEAYFQLTAVDDQGQESAPSSVLGVRPDGVDGPRVLVVDGFLRTTGAWRSGAHAFAALVGRSVAASGRSFDECSTFAVRDGSIALSSYTSVIWLSGDQSVTDAALDHVEEAKLTDYVSGGGTLFLSGSEIGYDLAATSPSARDRAFVSNVLHASYAGDTAGSHSVRGVGGGFLDGLSLSFGGASASYRVGSPDFLRAGTGARLALSYGDGTGAAVASNSGVFYLGFPVEAIDAASDRDALVAKVLAWQDSVRSR